MNSKQSARNLPTSSPHSAAEPPIDFRHIRHLLREKVRFIVLCTLGAMTLAGVYLFLAHPIYSSTATLVIEQQDRKTVNTLLDSQDTTQNDLHTLDVIKTVEQSLTSDALALRVIQANGLATNPHFVHPRPDKPYSDDELLLTFAKRVLVKLRRGTRLIDVTAESDSPLLAKQIAQSLINEYLHDGSERAADVSKSADDYLTGEAAQIRSRLEKSERDLQTYREQNNALSLEDKQNIVVETLKDLNLKLNTVRTDRMRLEADDAQYQALAARGPQALLALAEVANSATVVDAQRRVADGQQLVAQLSRRYRFAHPKYIQAQNQLTQAQDDLGRAVVKVGETIPVAYHAAQENEGKLQAALQEQEQAASSLNQIAIPYNALNREVESNRALYQSILNRLKQTTVTQALSVNPVQIAEPARATTEPVRPKKLLILAAATILGLFGSIAWCLASDAASPSLRTVDEAESALGLSVMCAVPRVAARKGARDARGVVMVSQPASLAAEAFRSLRTVLGVHETGGQQRVVFTSAVPGEGKTFCAVNCAVALAQQGYRTLLVDADLRRPALAGIFERDAQAPGFSNYLAGSASLAEATGTTGVENLHVLTAGTPLPNPAELLTNARLAELVRDPGFARYDRVVFDTAPINAVSDALPLVRHASALCLVVRAGATPLKACRRAHATLVTGGAAEVGVVLNALPERGGADFFYHYAIPYAGTGADDAAKPSRR